MDTNELIAAINAVIPILPSHDTADAFRSLALALAMSAPKQSEAPAPPLVKYAPGQVVMVPMLVVDIDDDPRLPYSLVPLWIGKKKEYLEEFGPDFYPSAAIEPPAPAVGDMCWFWDCDGDTPVKGELERIITHGDRLLPYLCDNNEYYQHCIRANDPD